ncbi:MAG: hypothetical protein Q9195_001503 [Heterodermia aff. obscurata]
MPCPDGDKTNFIVNTELRNPDGFAPVHAWFVVPGLFADQGWENYYPLLIPQALPMFPLGVYCAYLKSVNRDAFPFIAILDDLLHEQHLKDTTPKYTDPAFPSQRINTMPATMQAVQSGQQAAAAVPKTWAGVAGGSFQSSDNPHKVEAPAKVDAPVKTDTAVPFQRQLNGNQLRKAKRQHKAGAEAHADKEVPGVTTAENIQRQKSTSPVEDSTGTSSPSQVHTPGTPLSPPGAGTTEGKDSSPSQVHTPDTPLSPPGAATTEGKEIRTDKVLDAHWPALSPSKAPIKNTERTIVNKLPDMIGNKALTGDSTPLASGKVEDELPQSAAQASLVGPKPPQLPTENLEEVEYESQQVPSTEVKPKTKGQKKNERRRNAKQAKKLKEEEEAAVLSSATASALAASTAQSASMDEAKIKTKAETTNQTDQRKQGPTIPKSGKPAKANPSAVKAAPVKAKSPPVFSSIPSSSFEPVLSEKPQELKWDVPPKEEPVDAHSCLQLPVFAGSSNILLTGDTEQEIQKPLIESMSTASPPHSGLFTIPHDIKDSNQSAPKKGLFSFSSPSISLSPPAAKEPFLTERNDLNVPAPNPGFASPTPEPESLSLPDQSPNVSSIDTPCVPLEDISDSTTETVAKVNLDDVEAAPEKIPRAVVAHPSEAVVEDPAEGSLVDVAGTTLENSEGLFEHTMENNAPQSSPDSDTVQLASQIIRISEWQDDLYIDDLREWTIYDYEPVTWLGAAGPSDEFTLLACHKESDLTYEFNWEVPHLWGEPVPLHLQSSPTPSHFVEFGREISEIFDEDMDVSQASDDGTEAETSQVAVEVNDADYDDVSVITNSLSEAEDLQSDKDFSGAITDIPQQSESPPVKDHHHMDDSMPPMPAVPALPAVLDYMKYYQGHNIRDNVLFFMEEEKGDVSDTGIDSNRDHRQGDASSEHEVGAEENHNMDSAEEDRNVDSATEIPNVDSAKEDHNVDTAKEVPNVDKAEETPNVATTLPHAPQDVKIQRNVVSPYEDYDIMRNVYWFMQKENDVSNKATKSCSGHSNEVANSELASSKKDNATGDSVESLGDSPADSNPRSGPVVVGSVSSVKTGTSPSVNEAKSVPSLRSLGPVEWHIDLTESSTDAEAVKAHLENIAILTLSKISQQDSSQQKEKSNGFIYKFGSATVWLSKRGYEVGKAAAIVALIPADLAIQATISSLKVTIKTSFLIGRWACARFGPPWLGRFVGA